jgi:hypothetical protein
MSRDEAYLQRVLAPVLGNVRARGLETRRVAFDIAMQRVNRRVVHGSSPTGHEDEHGVAEIYRGLLAFASAAHQKAVIEEVQKLEMESMPALQTLAKQRGYYGSHPPKQERYELIKNYKPQMMEGYTMPTAETPARPISSPVLGNGTFEQSKFTHVPDAEYEPGSDIFYGNPKTARGSDQTSRFANVPQAPRLPNGEIDYDKLNEMNGHRSMSGRRNINIKQGQESVMPGPFYTDVLKDLSNEHSRIRGGMAEAMRHVDPVKFNRARAEDARIRQEVQAISD